MIVMAFGPQEQYLNSLFVKNHRRGGFLVVEKLVEKVVEKVVENYYNVGNV